MFWLVAAGAGLLVASSCVDVAPRHWADADEVHSLPTVGTRRVAIRATGGYVQVRAAPDGADTIEVHAFLRGGGLNQADAEECLGAMEIALPVSGGDDATQEISWAWKQPKKPHWSPSVSFEIVMPVDLQLAVDTDNGKIDVVGIVGDCNVTTVNGAVRVVAARHSLSARSTNGAVFVESPAEKVDIRTVNGRIEARLGDGPVAGSVTTTNGSIELALATAADVELRCRTTNGRVKSKLPLEKVEKRGRTSLTGQLGDGAGKLDVRTTNGDIELAPSATEGTPRRK